MIFECNRFGNTTHPTSPPTPINISPVTIDVVGLMVRGFDDENSNYEYHANEQISPRRLVGGFDDIYLMEVDFDTFSRSLTSRGIFKFFSSCLGILLNGR